MPAARTGTARAWRPGPIRRPGPFFVEGAEPGDMLVVSIEKIEVNRADAYSGSLLAPYALDPAAIGQRVDREARRVTWKLDKARGVATLSEPGITPALELPAAPDAGLRRRGAGAQGGHRHQHARAPSAATWTTPAWSPA